MSRLFILAVMAVLPLAAFDDEDKKETPSEYVADPRYIPAVGDRVHLFAVDKEGIEFVTWCATEPYYFRDYAKALSIRDDDGSRELEKTGRIKDLQCRTSILVLSLEPAREHEGTIISASAEVRILEGPHKGKKYWTPQYHVARIIHKSDLPKSKGKTKPKGRPKR